MAIGEFTGRQRAEIWKVVRNGQTLVRGLSKDKAEAYCSRYAMKNEQVRGGTKIPHQDYDIQRDVEAMHAIDRLYTEFRGYRNGD